MLDLKVSHMVLVFIRLYIVQELKGPIRMGLRVYSCKYKVLLALKQWSCIVIHSGLYIGVITWHCLVETKGLVLIFTCDWIIGIFIYISFGCICVGIVSGGHVLFSYN